MVCRFCNNELTHEFVDLGNAPPSNAFLAKSQLGEPEVFYPLKAFVCEACFLVQVDEYRRHDAIFDDRYAYFSSYSSTWLEHARNYVDMISARLGLSAASHVVEIASNDGYLLQYFAGKGIPCLGIEPAANTAAVAQAKGIPVITEFFGPQLAERLVRDGRMADLIIGNNVLAHVPDLNGFVRGLKTTLRPGGTITMEFPHLMRLVAKNEFDTIYHEHFSYFSLHTVERLFAAHGLVLFDVEELPTHGGSLRIYARHAEDPSRPIAPAVAALQAEEARRGMLALPYYQAFQGRVDHVKQCLLAFLIEQKRHGRQTVGYGAAAKGNTLLNYCGVRKDLLEYVVDRSPHKQGLFLPGTHIPVVAEDCLRQTKPAYVLILPWNLSAEISLQLSYIRAWGGRCVVPIPEVQELQTP